MTVNMFIIHSYLFIFCRLACETPSNHIYLKKYQISVRKGKPSPCSFSLTCNLFSCLTGSNPFFFYRCGHCKRLAPEYEAAATRLKGIVPLAKVIHSSVPWALELLFCTPLLSLKVQNLFCLQVDCTANSNVCSKYGVSGYPTLKIFRDGEESGPYDGPRSAGTLLFFVKGLLSAYFWPLLHVSLF